jgi:hypothetical protein
LYVDLKVFLAKYTLQAYDVHKVDGRRVVSEDQVTSTHGVAVPGPMRKFIWGGGLNGLSCRVKISMIVIKMQQVRV